MSNNSDTNLKNILSNLIVAAKALESKIKQADSFSHTNLKNALSSLTAAAKRLESKIKRDNSYSHPNLRDALSNLIVASKTLESKIKQADPSSHTNLRDALSSLTAATKKLESIIKQAESSSDKVGQILVSKKIITESDLSAAIERKKREPDKYLGQILCEMGLPQFKIIKEIYVSNKRKPLGQILVEQNIINAAQLDNILLEQEHLTYNGEYKPLGALLSKKGIISEDNYLIALSAHFSIPIISLKGFQVSSSLQEVIGTRYALKNQIVVLSNSAKKVHVAMAEPRLLILENLEKSIPHGKCITFSIARCSEIEDCLNEWYFMYG